MLRPPPYRSAATAWNAPAASRNAHDATARPTSRVSLRRVASAQPKSRHDEETNLLREEATNLLQVEDATNLLQVEDATNLRQPARLSPLDGDDDIPTINRAPSRQEPAFPPPAKQQPVFAKREAVFAKPAPVFAPPSAEAETRLARRKARREPVENSDDFRENSIRARRLERSGEEPRVAESRAVSQPVAAQSPRAANEARLSYHPRTSTNRQRAAVEQPRAFDNATGRTGRTGRSNDRFTPAPQQNQADRYVKSDGFGKADRYLKSQPRSLAQQPVVTGRQVTGPVQTRSLGGSRPRPSQPVTTGRRDVSVNAPWTFPTDAGAIHSGKTVAKPLSLSSLSGIKVHIIYAVMIASVAVLIASAISFHSSLRDQAAIQTFGPVHATAAAPQAPQALPPAANHAPAQAMAQLPQAVAPAQPMQVVAPAQAMQVVAPAQPMQVVAPAQAMQAPPAQAPAVHAMPAATPRFAPASTPPTPRWTMPAAAPKAAAPAPKKQAATNLEQIMSDGLSGG